MSSLVSTILRPEHCDPLALVRELGKAYEHCALLESAERTHGVCDASFIALGARSILTVQGPTITEQRGGHVTKKDGNLTAALTSLITEKRQARALAMGHIGFVSYEAMRLFDAIDLTPEPHTPDAYFVLPEVMIAINHKERTVTMTTHADATIDGTEIEDVIMHSPYFDDSPTRAIYAPSLFSLDDIQGMRQTSRRQYCSNVQKIQEQIKAGETFQVVLSQELRLRTDASTIDVYRELRRINPSPYMYYFRSPEITIVGASPETLIRVSGNDMLYRPIAGTRKRTGDEKLDAAMRQELLADSKERCEHQMLVDLGRSDMGRVASIGSVAVHDPFHIEQYAHVYHIVSDITAKLRADATSIDAVKAVFPAGTLTGAPKLRAMEIIRDIESSPRGIYGGAFGYIDSAGNLDMAIAIRTLIFRGNEASLRVGAGIVHSSIAEHEDNECLHKARSCLAAIKAATSSPNQS